MATPFHVELVSPERTLFSGEADEVSLRSDEGEIAFLAHHEDYIGAVDVTVVRVHTVSGTGSQDSPEDGGDEVLIAVHGGFVHVDADGVVILAGVAELASEIDIERARAALSSAKERVGTEQTHGGDGSDEFNNEEQERLARGATRALLFPESPEARLRRAQVRLETAGASA